MMMRLLRLMPLSSLLSIVALTFDWSLQPNHFQIVEHYAVVRATHAIVGEQIAAMDAVQIVRYGELCFEQLSGILFYPNNETEIPYERSFALPMVHAGVHATERMYDAQRHTSINACTPFRCIICMQLV